MAIDVAALEAAQQQQVQVIGHLQRTIDALVQQQALHTQALVHAVRGEWDAAQFGAESVEAYLVALNPSLQGKVHPLPFGTGR